MTTSQEHHCLAWPELEALAALPPEAAARRALAECPRCLARLGLLTEFLADTSRPAGAQPEAAALALRQAFAAELDVRAARAGHRWLRPRLAWRLAAGFAAVFCLFALVHVRGWFAPELSPRWRGEQPAAQVSLLPARRDAAGELLLSWCSLPGAVYRVDLLDADLELLRSIAATDTLLRVDPAALPAGELPPWAWQVTAFAAAGDSTLARSPLGLLPAP